MIAENSRKISKIECAIGYDGLHIAIWRFLKSINIVLTNLIDRAVTVGRGRKTFEPFRRIRRRLSSDRTKPACPAGDKMRDPDGEPVPARLPREVELTFFSFKRAALASTACLAALSAATSAQAQVAAEAGEPQSETSDASPGQGEIVVTAQRRSESIQSVPISIQAISSDAIEERGIRNPQDLAQFTPNVSISSPTGVGGAPSITIRGVGLNDFNTNNSGPNGVYVDEFYISAPNAQGLSLFDLERIEVLKGPQGTLYGRNTNGGAINIITAKPSQDFKAHVRGEYGSYDTVNVEAAVGGGLTPTLSGRLSGVYNYSSGYMRNDFLGLDENGTNNFAVRGQLLWEPSNELTVRASAQVFRMVTRAAAYKLYGTLDPLTGDVCSAAATFANQCVDLFGYRGSGSDEFYRSDSNLRQKLKTTDVQTTLRADYDAGGITVTSLSGYNYNSSKHPDNTDTNPFRSLEIDFNANSYEFTQELRLSQTEDRYNWVAGVYYLNEIVKQDQPLYLLLDLDDLLGPGGSDGIAAIQSTFNRQKTQSVAGFGQLEWKVADRFSLIAGARYTWEKKDFSTISYQRLQQGGKDNFGPIQDLDTTSDSLTGKRFNFRLAANYKPSRDLLFYANLATGYKAGGFNGGFLANDPDLRALQLRPVKAETVTSYEIGAKTSLFDRAVTFNIAGFYNDYRNQQLSVLVPNPNPTRPSFFALDNAKKARTYGADIELTVRPTSGLALSGQLGLLSSKLIEFVASRDVNQPDYSGNRLTQAPKTSLTLAADYDLPIGDNMLKLHYDTNYRSLQYFEPSNSAYTTQPAYWIHNARIAYTIDDRFEIGAFARNFSATKYFVWISNLTDPLGSIQGNVGAPRTFGVDLRMTFGG